MPVHEREGCSDALEFQHTGVYHLMPSLQMTRLVAGAAVSRGACSEKNAAPHATLVDYGAGSRGSIVVCKAHGRGYRACSRGSAGNAAATVSPTSRNAHSGGNVVPTAPGVSSQPPL